MWPNATDYPEDLLIKDKSFDGPYGVSVHLTSAEGDIFVQQTDLSTSEDCHLFWEIKYSERGYCGSDHPGDDNAQMGWYPQIKAILDLGMTASDEFMIHVSAQTSLTYGQCQLTLEGDPPATWVGTNPNPPIEKVKKGNRKLVLILDCVKRDWEPFYTPVNPARQESLKLDLRISRNILRVLPRI